MIKRGVTHKTIILSAILLVICLLLSGCGGKSTFDGSRTSDETGFRMEYSILDKEESAELKLTKDDQMQVHISHTAGNVDVIVGQKGEEPIYKGTAQECGLHSDDSENRLLSDLCNRPSGKGRDLFYLHPIEREMKGIWQTQ